MPREPTALDLFVAELIYTAGPELVNDALEAALEPDASADSINRHIRRWAREISDQLTDALP